MNKKLLPVAVVLIIFLGVASAVLANLNKTDNAPILGSPVPTTNLGQKTLYSTNREFTIMVPEGFIVTENSENTIELTGPDGSGKILITWTGIWNYDNLEDFLRDPRINVYDKISDRKKLTINGLPAISGIKNKERIYYIYNDYTSYQFGTYDKALYETLDQIAQSFRYVGR